MIKLPIHGHEDERSRLINYYNQILEPHGAMILEVSGDLRPYPQLSDRYTMVNSKTGVKLDEIETKRLSVELYSSPWMKAYPKEAEAILQKNQEYDINTEIWNKSKTLNDDAMTRCFPVLARIISEHHKGK